MGRRKWQEEMGNKSTLEKYRSKEEKKFEEWLDREEGRTVFNIRGGSLRLRTRTGRTTLDRNVWRGRLKLAACRA